MLLIILISIFSTQISALSIIIEDIEDEPINTINIAPSRLIMPKNVIYDEVKHPIEKKQTIQLDDRVIVKKNPFILESHNDQEPSIEKYKFCLVSFCGLLILCGVTLGFVELVTHLSK
jgi:hypothetical protein